MIRTQWHKVGGAVALSCALSAGCASARPATHVLGERLVRDTLAVAADPGPAVMTSPISSEQASAGPTTPVAPSAGAPTSSSSSATTAAGTTRLEHSAPSIVRGTPSTTSISQAPGTISGLVYRSGISVSLSRGTVVAAHTVSDLSGRFTLANLVPGTYDLETAVVPSGESCDGAGVCLVEPSSFSKRAVTVLAGVTLEIDDLLPPLAVPPVPSVIG